MIEGSVSCRTTDCLRHGLGALAGLECAVCGVWIEREVFRPPQDPLLLRWGSEGAWKIRFSFRVSLVFSIQTKILGSKPTLNLISSDGQVGKARH